MIKRVIYLWSHSKTRGDSDTHPKGPYTSQSSNTPQFKKGSKARSSTVEAQIKRVQDPRVDPSTALKQELQDLYEMKMHKGNSLFREFHFLK